MISSTRVLGSGGRKRTHADNRQVGSLVNFEWNTTLRTDLLRGGRCGSGARRGRAAKWKRRRG